MLDYNIIKLSLESVFLKAGLWLLTTTLTNKIDYIYLNKP